MNAQPRLQGALSLKQKGPLECYLSEGALKSIKTSSVKNNQYLKSLKTQSDYECKRLSMLLFVFPINLIVKSPKYQMLGPEF